jgi:hypothetical protein
MQIFDGYGKDRLEWSAFERFLLGERAVRHDKKFRALPPR